MQKYFCLVVLMPSSLTSTGLFLINFDYVVLFHFQCFWSFIVIDTTSIEQESEGGDGDSDSLAVGLLQFAHLSSLLDAEMDLIRVLAHNLEI